MAAPPPEEGGGRRLARRSILAGSVAGMASVALFHPLDVLRIKMQMQAAAALPGSASASASAPRPAAVFFHTVRNGGITALYTGAAPVLAAQACYKATVFSVNGLAGAALARHRAREGPGGGGGGDPPSLAETWLCGWIGGAVNATVFVSPVEYVRNQQIAQHSRLAAAASAAAPALPLAAAARGPLDIARTTVRRDGLPGLWRGAGVTILRDSLGCGSFFVSFELGRRWLGPHLGGSDSGATLLASGACAGWGFWAFALPFDTVKTLIQTGRATSAWDTVAGSLRNGGVAETAHRLTRGWQLAFGRGGPAAAVTLSTYAAVFDLCGRLFDE